MAELSGYDSEVVGFDCIPEEKSLRATTSSQTSEFFETGTSSQTNLSKDIGCTASPEDLNAEGDILKEYSPLDLNKFLRKVVPAMMEQLDQNDREFINNSSDSDEEEIISAKTIQQIDLKDAVGSGDHESSILGISWSSAGNSFAVTIGQMLHETWCHSAGLIKVFTLKRAEDKFVHTLDLSENNCVTALKYHPTVAALLAYGTTSGEVVICNLMNSILEEGSQLASPSECHDSRRVTFLQWADAPLANIFLLMQINNKKKRRGAADQVLFSSGADGTINVWQVNANLKVFENIISYMINRSRNSESVDITCFDFIKTHPLRPSDEKVPDDIFVVGTQTGRIFLCKIQGTGDILDPVYDEVDAHGTCVLDVAFNAQKPGVFVSISIDSELRVYDINQSTPLKVICLDISISSLSWLIPPCVVVGVVGGEDLVKVYNVASGRVVPVAGMSGQANITCLAVSQNGYRIAAGDKMGTVRIWELPTRRIKLSVDDLDF